MTRFRDGDSSSLDYILHENINSNLDKRKNLNSNKRSSFFTALSIYLPPQLSLTAKFACSSPERKPFRITIPLRKQTV